MSKGSEIEQIKAIQKYYHLSEGAYKNWGKDLDRQGIYALHCGYEEPGETISHWESIKQLTKMVLAFMEIQDGDVVLDAGCGSGVAAFEITSQYPSTIVHGVNLAFNQLLSAQQFGQLAEISTTYFSVQDYLRTAYASESYSKIVFIESIAHAQTKQLALREACRLLKPNGTITIADIFFHRSPQNDNEVQWVSDLIRGWYMPDLMSITAFEEQIKHEGLNLLKNRDISNQVLPSTLRMRQNAEIRLMESKGESIIPDEIDLSRKAVVASHKVVASGFIGYHLLHLGKK